MFSVYIHQQVTVLADGVYKKTIFGWFFYDVFIGRVVGIFRHCKAIKPRYAGRHTRTCWGW